MPSGLALAGSNFWTASGAFLSPDASQGYSGVNFASAGLLEWNSDLALARLAAASLRIGLAPSATPVAQSLTVGEASRPGTDTDVGGASGTIASGLGTGTGAASSLIFQTPTLAGAGSGTQALATRLTIATATITATVPVLVPAGSAANPSFGFSSNGGLGLDAHLGANAISFNASSAERMRLDPNSLSLGTLSLGFGSAVGTNEFSLNRWASNTLALAKDASSPPALKIQGGSSQAGVDSNTGGGGVTFASGIGTGTGTASSLSFQTPTLAVSGTGAQTLANRMVIATAGITLLPPDQGLRIDNQVSGAAAQVGTLTNSPVAGNPNFWLPISIAGTLRWIACW